MKYYLWIIFFLTSMAQANCALRALNVKNATLSTAIQYDFARNASKAPCYWEAWPSTVQELSALVKIAYQNHIPIRTQGAAHSLHGHALPQEAELVIHTTRLNTIAFNRIGTVSVDAGVPLRWLQMRINANTSFILPVANGGGIAPSVGGYLAAGGISPDSANYGGFWEHVSRITLIAANGKIVNVREKEALFPWLFGSQGELGIIANVTLKLLRDEQKPFNYPLGFTLHSTYPSSNGHTWQNNTRDASLFWFNVLATPAQLARVKNKFNALMQHYPEALAYRPLYFWPIRRLTFIPPLLSNHDQHLIAIGLWGEKGASPRQFNALKKDFIDWTNATQLAHYGQVEPFTQLTLDANTYQTFMRYKNQLDPDHLFNQASLFNKR